MKFTELYYEKVFPIAPYVNEKIGVRMSIEEGEDAKAAIEAAREFARESFYEKYGDMVQHSIEFDEPPPPVIQAEKLTPKERRINQIAESFNGCTSVASLETFKLLVQKENDESLTAAYESKLKSLSNG